ncbi:hypothetical protein GALMADRAFT_86504 [Galerina marginata CBS 339.88]|uniref:Vacuolar ATPase assembly integral membrane protein VMA21 n=1 Tax=Galerina marginata (strain CBS 339.88) TaxID=685588 RepID=A0A067TKV7_GALM3|nr:hypothetical protein GALMADRAFT_86504 [Galerina marginata CBS 339.88]
MSEQVVISKINADAAAGGVLFKLIVFSVSLGVIPLASYFLSLDYLWHGNSTFAAITAVVAANVVLVAYIISSVLEDKKDALSTSQKEQVDTKKNK